MSHNNTSEYLHTELKNLTNSLEELLSTSTKTSKNELDKLLNKAQIVLKDTRSRLGQSSDCIANTTQKVADLAEFYVHEHPWISISISAMLGIILGLSLARH